MSSPSDRNLITLPILGKEYKLQNTSFNVPGILREVSNFNAARDFIHLFIYLFTLFKDTSEAQNI
jgi:hypothetical protein